MDFLESVADYYISNLSHQDWSRLVFVFPNKRAGVFFQEALRNRVKSHGRFLFGINIQVLGDLLAAGSGVSLADPMLLRCKLYDVYCQIMNEAGLMARDFECFYSWAAAIINDFDDIDKYMVDPAHIFANLQDHNALKDEMSYLSEEQRQAIESFWDVAFQPKVDSFGNEVVVYERFENSLNFKELYDRFRSALKADKLAYSGMVFRDVAECGDWKWDSDPTVRYAFVGFSLLSQSEIAIMKRLADVGRADFFWDYTPNMLKENPSDVHGIGFAVNKWRTRFPAPAGFTPPVSDSDANPAKYQLLEVAYPQAQAEVVARYLTGVCDKIDALRTAVIVPDESLLLPTLSLLPGAFKNVNVTMGYRLHYAPISGLVHLMASIQHGMWHRANPPDKDGQPSFSSRIVLPVLQDQCVASVISQKVAEAKIADLVKNNRNYISRDELESIDFVHELVRKVQPEDLLSQYVIPLLEKTLATYRQQNDEINVETTWQALKAARRMGDVIGIVQNNVRDSRLVMHMIASIIDQQSVDFKGMPLAGLQVMGVLETRAVDFDHVVILDMTEGAWPRSVWTETMLPNALRYGFGLPTQDLKDSSYAYYFFRLIHRAKSVTMIHPGGGPKSQGNVSRYVHQLRMVYGLNVNHVTITDDVVIADKPHIQISGADVHDLLRQRYLDPASQAVMSPTALSNYIQCHLKFLLVNVLKIDNQDEITSEADARHLGIIFHHVLETLYKPAPGSSGFLITKSRKQDLLNNPDRITDIIIEGFRESLKMNIYSEAELTGRNILTFNVVKDCILQMIRQESDNTVVVDTERKVQFSFDVSGGQVRLYGVVDRLSIGPDGTFYVVDYKTGAVGTKAIGKVEDLFAPQLHDKNKAVMQILCYCYMLRKKYDELKHTPLVPFVAKMSDVFDDDYSGTATFGKNKDLLVFTGDLETEFSAMLENLIQEIFDPKTVFGQTENEKSCSLCNLASLCRRN